MQDTKPEHSVVTGFSKPSENLPPGYQDIYIDRNHRLAYAWRLVVARAI